MPKSGDQTAKADEYRDSRQAVSRMAATMADAAIEVAWSQWEAMGSTASARTRARSIVDPEALVLVSLALASRERRLDDVMHDWVAIASTLLSVQRINNLAAAYPDGMRPRLASLARTALERGKDFRWRVLASGAITGERGGARARTNKMRAVQPPLLDAPILLPRLRLAFGVGIKADTLGFLLGTEGAWASVRVIAAATGYTPSAVRRAAEDLAAARVIQSAPDSATLYRADADAWSAALEIRSPMPVWRGWHERFAFVAAFLEWSEVAHERPMTRYALGAAGRSLLEAHRAAFERNRLVPWDPDVPADQWGAELETAVTTLASWMREMV